jgi:RNA polymerase sigma factor (sigma-70 family)
LTPAEINDVFQTVWLSLLRNLDSIRQPDRIAAWLVTTTRRECWERRRGGNYEKFITSELDSLIATRESEDPAPDELVSIHERHHVLRAAIDQLDERCRRLLYFLYYDADIPSYSDVAEKMNMPIGSIGPLRARCLRKLRKIMEDQSSG